MREIKFRAWDTSRKVMHSAYEMGQDQEALLPDGRGFANISSTSTKLTQIHSNLLPLQYTGLKDKNGKEIYEGDIVQIKVNQCVWRYEVTTIDSFGSNLFLVTRYRNFEIEGDYYRWGDFFVNEGRSLIIKDSNYEVSGNIYENPELLITNS